jgi:glycosyltransferase involved in cell wall biosynthesis
MTTDLDLLYFGPKSDHGAEPCRILFLMGSLGGGGAERQLVYLLQAMDRPRHRPALVVWNYQESDVFVPKVRSLGIPFWGFPIEDSSYRKLYQFARLARRLSPEVVHSYSNYTNFAAFCAAHAAGSIGIGSVQNEIDPACFIKKRPIMGRLSASLPRLQMSNSHAAAERIMASRRLFAPKRFAIVTNPIDLKEFRDDPVPMKPPHVILGIGSLKPMKRWDRLLKIAKELKLRNLPVQIQIAGDGPLRGQLEAMAADLGITGMIRFLGFRSDIPDLIAGARLIVHTSDAEGTPNVVMEALAAGRAVVATDAGDVDKLIINGETGFVVALDDIETLVARIIDLVTDDGLAERMGKAAREYARREFSMARPLNEMLDVYRSAGWKS